MAAKGYIKLDHDWRDDDKVMLFEERHGKAALVDWITLCCLMSEFYGVIDMTDEAAALKVRKKLGKTASKTNEFLGQCADCRLISPEWWDTFRRVGSERSVKDGESRKKRREYAAKASEAAREKRNDA